MKKQFVFLFFMPAFLIAQVSNFSININGAVPAGLAQAMDIAAEKWSLYLQINIPVKVNVFTVNSNFLPFSGLTLANGRRNFSNAPQGNVLYVSSLANQLAGTELNPGEYDMDIYFNLASNFYFGTGKPTSTQLDFISTAMHEIGHGLGFYSDGYVDAQGKGSFGNIPSSVIFPLSTSFPWRGQDSVPSIYDKYIVRASGTKLFGAALENTTAQGDRNKNGAVYFDGPVFANPSHANARVRLAGGTGVFSFGEDLLHIHQSYSNTIMSYYWGSGDTVRIPAPWEIGILEEIGWNKKMVGLREDGPAELQLRVYPNPAENFVVVKAPGLNTVRLSNAMGVICREMRCDVDDNELKFNTSELPPGIYFLVAGVDAIWIVSRLTITH
jgi:hypothetical protein